MENHNQKNLQPSVLLASDEFKKNSEHIIRRLNIPYNCETANDLRQEMAIAVMESLNTYNPDKIGKNFWGHANLWMNSRAKKFLQTYGTLVRLPINRQGGAHWEKMGYEAETITVTYFENWEYSDSDKRLSDNEIQARGIYSSITLKELYNAICSELTENEKYVILVKLGWTCTKNRKSDFKSISDDLGIKTATARTLYAKAKQKLISYFSLDAAVTCGERTF